MAQKPQNNQNTKPDEADRTVRLPRKGLGLEKDEPTQALQMQMGVPAAESTLRLKRDEMSLEEPTVALKAGVPAAESTLRLKRDEMSFEEPTQALERPKLRTAMEVIDEATQVETPQVKPSVMMPDATDIPSWEETTQLFIPPPSGHAESTVHLPRPLEPLSVQVDPMDSMDETFSDLSTPALPQAPVPTPTDATSLMLVSEIAETEEETLVLPDMHELDELPNAMRATIVMPVMEAPVAPLTPEPMEATVVLHVEPPLAPMEKTTVMPVLDANASSSASAPLAATTIMPVSVEEPSAYLTRQGQSPWPSSSQVLEPSPVSTQLMSGSLLFKAMEATGSDTDSALAPIPPEVSAMEDNSPLAKAADIPSPNPIQTSSPVPDRIVDTSTGMAMTPPTLLMPIQRPLDPTVPIHRSQPRAFKPESKSAETKPVEPKAVVPSPSVPGYPDRQLQVPVPEPKFQTKPIEKPEKPERPASQLRPVSPAYLPMAPQTVPAESSSKIGIPIAIVVLLLVIGGIYFAFFRPSLKIKSPLVILPNQTAEPSLPVPAGMQGTLAQAKAGDSKAMHMLGVSFYYGLNVPPNKTEGLRWMRKAAEAGNEKAKSDLRQMESEGR